MSWRVAPPRRRTPRLHVALVIVTSSISNRAHPLALPVRRRRIVPQTRKVAGQRQNPLPFPFVQSLARFGTAALKLVLCLVQSSELRVPLRLQHIGDHPVVGMGLHEPLPRQVRFLAGALHALSAPQIGLPGARGEFILHLQRQVQRER